MVHALVPPFLFLFAQQQAAPSEIEKAIQKDAAASASAASATGSPQATPNNDSAPTTAPADAPDASSGRRPGGSLMNPAMSVILDGTFGYYGRHASDFQAAALPPAGDDPSPTREGFGMQEVEVALQSAIDPYLEGALFLTIPNLEGLEVEEAYLVTTSLPWNLQAKAGSFRSQMGRNNTQHLHLQHFTRRPLFTSLLFGADGLRGPGAQVSALLPLPWFTTVYLEAFSIGPPDDLSLAATFGGGGRRDFDNLTYAAIVEQYWDLTENASLMWGMNAAAGRLADCGGAVPPDCAVGGNRPNRTFLYGTDLTYHWKPANVAQTYASVQWTTELFFRTITLDGGTQGAGYTEPVVQVARRWYMGGRFDLVGVPTGIGVPRRYGYSASVTFAPSEFSRFRLYAQEIAGPGTPNSTVAFFQTEVSLGAHGAHPY